LWCDAEAAGRTIAAFTLETVTKLLADLVVDQPPPPHMRDAAT
jgi:hypothetical protein